MTSSFPPYVKPNLFGVDAGVLYVGAAAVGFGASEGGFTWDPGIEYQSPQFDGKAADIQLLQRVVDYTKNKLSGSFLDASGTAFGRYTPGSSSDGSVGTNTITPIDAFVFFAAGDYLTDVQCIWRRSDNSTIRVFMPVAYVSKFQYKTKPKKEALADIEITAVLGSAVIDISSCPYTYQDSAS
ncbi:MAG TPA: hypothetical protein VN607_08560 [Gemmatimonadaceae bacterium]|nr:hypothetical protein [Gemmatimonadaceae bacterium]